MGKLCVFCHEDWRLGASLRQQSPARLLASISVALCGASQHLRILAEDTTYWSPTLEYNVY